MVRFQSLCHLEWGMCRHGWKNFGLYWSSEPRNLLPPMLSIPFSQTRPSLKALRKAWKERAHRQIPRWNCPIHRRTLSSGFSIAKAIDFFLSSWPKRIWKLRTHWTGLRPGALMYSSLRDGLQPNQEPGIFLWPLPGPFPCSHLFSIIPDREENGNRKYRNYVC